MPRLSWHDTTLVARLPADRSTAIAKSLAQAGGDAQLVPAAHDEPAHMVVLEPEAWHNQRPRTVRSREFKGLGAVASLVRKLDPATLRFASARGLVEYSYAFVAAQQVRSSDAVLLPAHLAGGHGRAGREGELRLAEAGAALVKRRGFAKHKPLLVGIAIQASAITSADKAVALARSYADLECDGYWVQFAGLSESEKPTVVSMCATFLFALQEVSGRPVFAVDCKNLTWPLLAAGLAGACIGIGEREAWQGPAGASNKRRKIKPSVLHPVLLRNFRVDGPHTTAAFADLECACGAHPAGRAPLTRPEIRQHALHVRLRMADAVTGEHAAQIIDHWLYDAGWAAYDLGLDPPPVAAYRAVLDAADGFATAGEL